jgi:signal transduction histidine kinase
MQIQLIRLNDGLDRAIHFAVRRYTQHRDHLKDRFIGILGHDLRNPLGAAATATHSLLRSKSLSDRDRKRVFVIRRATARMERMISDVLDFSRGHLAGGIPATPIPCDMGEICRSAVEEAHNAHPERAISITTKGDLQGAFDPERVSQAIGNLLSNAIHHGEDPVTLTAVETDDRTAVLTEVTNRGKAIGHEIIGKLFDPFVRAGQEAKGTLGLGLYIVAQIAMAHGARCEVTSTDQETRFTIRWPRAVGTEHSTVAS